MNTTEENRIADLEKAMHLMLKSIIELNATNENQHDSMQLLNERIITLERFNGLIGLIPFTN